MVERITNIPVGGVENNKLKLTNVMNGNNKILVKSAWASKHGTSQEGGLDNQLAQFDSIIESYNNTCIAINKGFDNIPCATLCNGIAWLMSLAYGCKLVRVGGRINSEPMYHSIAEACQMEKIEKIYNNGLYPIITERIMKFQSLYPDIPISLPDNQSPIDVLTCILQSEAAIYGMFDDSDTIHQMLDIITDSMIEVNRYYESIIHNFAGFRTGAWQQKGMHVSDDNAAFLSPSTYLEFAKPYVEKLSDEFGGINFHCCMGYTQNLESISSVKGFFGYDAHPDFNPMDQIIANIADKNAVWEVFNYPWSRNEFRAYLDEEMFKKTIDASNGKCGMIITVYDEDMDVSLKIAEKIKNYVVKMGREAVI